MDNLPGFVCANIIALDDILNCIINLQGKRANVRFIADSPMEIKHDQSELSFTVKPKRNEGLTTYEHLLSSFIPQYNIDEDTEKYLQKFSLKGGIAILTDTEGVKWVSGSIDAPLQLLYTPNVGEFGTGKRGAALEFSAVLTHPHFKYYEI